MPEDGLWHWSQQESHWASTWKSATLGERWWGTANLVLYPLLATNFDFGSDSVCKSLNAFHVGECNYFKQGDIVFLSYLSYFEDIDRNRVVLHMPLFHQILQYFHCTFKSSRGLWELVPVWRVRLVEFNSFWNSFYLAISLLTTEPVFAVYDLWLFWLSNFKSEGSSWESPSAGC